MRHRLSRTATGWSSPRRACWSASRRAFGSSHQESRNPAASAAPPSRLSAQPYVLEALGVVHAVTFRDALGSLANPGLGFLGPVADLASVLPQRRDLLIDGVRDVDP